MKRNYSFAIIALLFAFTLLFSVPVQSQNTASSCSDGKFGALFTFSGLSNLGAGNYNGGVGAYYYFDSNTFLRGSVGGNSVSGTTNYNFSGGVMHDQWHTKTTCGYFGAEGFYSGNNITTTKVYGVSGVFGVGVTPWENICLSAEYHLSAMYNSTTTATTWDLGAETGQLVIAVGLN